MKREEYIKTDSWIDQANDFTNPNLLFAQKALSFLRKGRGVKLLHTGPCLLYTSPSPRDA